MAKTAQTTEKILNFSTRSPVSDNLALLSWPLKITWFHDFGLASLGSNQYQIRISAGGGGGYYSHPFYNCLVVTLHGPNGISTASQDFPFNDYDSGLAQSTSKQFSLTHFEDELVFVMGIGESEVTAKKATKKDLSRLDPMCIAIVRWATLMSGSKLSKEEKQTNK